MNKVVFFFSLIICLIHSGISLECYSCEDCEYVNSDTTTETCKKEKILSIAEENTKPSPENYCIYIKYRIIDDREKVDRFCSKNPCSIVGEDEKYKVGQYCEECTTDKCNSNTATNMKNLPIILLLFSITCVKYIF